MDRNSLVKSNCNYASEVQANWRVDSELTELTATLAALAPESNLAVKFWAAQASAEFIYVKSALEIESREPDIEPIRDEPIANRELALSVASDRSLVEKSSVSISINCSDENGVSAGLSVKRGTSNTREWSDLSLFCARRGDEIRKALLSSAANWKAWVAHQRLAQILQVSTRPTFVVDANATVLISSGCDPDSAAAMPEMTIGMNKQLRLKNTKETCRLLKVISESLRLKERRALRLVDGLEEREWAIIVRPLPSGYEFTSGSEILRSQVHFDDLAIISIETGNPIQVSANLLKDFYDLTVSEAELAAAVVNGQTLSEYAQQKKISIATARWHLRNVLRGTSSKSQIDLVSKTIATLSHPAF